MSNLFCTTTKDFKTEKGLIDFFNRKYPTTKASKNGDAIEFARHGEVLARATIQVVILTGGKTMSLVSNPPYFA